MTPEENKANTKKFLDEVLNAHNTSILDQFMTPDFVYHDPGQPFPVNGLEGYAQYLQFYYAAFPDLHFTFDEIVAESDKEVVYWTSHGTHKGDLMGIPPTGKQVSITGMTMSRLNNEGLLVESWQISDTMGMMQQLGVIPTPSQAPA